MSVRAAVTGEDDVGTLVNCETIVLVLDRGLFDDLRKGINVSA